jgi:hypothetical protein
LTDLSLSLSSVEKITIANALLNREEGFDINQPLNPGVPCDQEYRFLDSAFDCLFEWETPDEELATFLVSRGADPSLCKKQFQSGDVFDSMKKLFASSPALEAIRMQLHDLSKDESAQLSTISKLYKDYLTSIMWDDQDIFTYQNALFVPPSDIDVVIYQKVIASAAGKSVDLIENNQILALIKAANHLQIDTSLVAIRLLKHADWTSFLTTQHTNPYFD